MEVLCDVLMEIQIICLTIGFAYMYIHITKNKKQ